MNHPNFFISYAKTSFANFSKPPPYPEKNKIINCKKKNNFNTSLLKNVKYNING